MEGQVRRVGYIGRNRHRHWRESNQREDREMYELLLRERTDGFNWVVEQERRNRGAGLRQLLRLHRHLGRAKERPTVESPLQPSRLPVSSLPPAPSSAQ